MVINWNVCQSTLMWLFAIGPWPPLSSWSLASPQDPPPMTHSQYAPHTDPPMCHGDSWLCLCLMKSNSLIKSGFWCQLPWEYVFTCSSPSHTHSPSISQEESISYSSWRPPNLSSMFIWACHLAWVLFPIWLRALLVWGGLVLCLL